MEQDMKEEVSEETKCRFCFDERWVCLEEDISLKEDPKSACPFCNPHRPCDRKSHKGKKPCTSCGGTLIIPMKTREFVLWKQEQFKKEIKKLQKARYQNSGLLDVYLDCVADTEEFLAELDDPESELMQSMAAPNEEFAELAEKL